MEGKRYQFLHTDRQTDTHRQTDRQTEIKVDEKINSEKIRWREDADRKINTNSDKKKLFGHVFTLLSNAVWKKKRFLNNSNLNKSNR